MGRNSIYEALKNEQTSRINFRDTALYLQLVSSTTALGFYVEYKIWTVLLLVALGAFVFSTLYFINDFFVGRIGAFLATFEAPYSDWETFHRLGYGYRLQKWMRRSLVVLSFVAAPITALWFIRQELGSGLSTAVFFGLLAPTLMGWLSAKQQPRTEVVPMATGEVPVRDRKPGSAGVASGEGCAEDRTATRPTSEDVQSNSGTR